MSKAVSKWEGGNWFIGVNTHWILTWHFRSKARKHKIANSGLLVLVIGLIEYSHGKGESGGNFAFKFDVVDGEGNKLIGQSFSISVSGKGALGVWKFSSSSEVTWYRPWVLSLFFTGLCGNLKSSQHCYTMLWLSDVLSESQTWGLCWLFWFYSWTLGPELKKKRSIKGCCCCQSLSRVQLFATLCATACQVPLSSTTSWNLLKFLSIESMVLSNHLILCHPLLLLPSIFPSIQVFSNESALHIR